MISEVNTLRQIEREMVKEVTGFSLLGTVHIDFSHKIEICLLLGRKAMTNLDNILRSRNITLLTKVCIIKEGWVLKNWCFWIVVLEKTLESPLDCKEIKPVDLKGNRRWVLIGRIIAEAEAPVFWPPSEKSWLFEKDPPDGRKDWRPKARAVTEDEMARQHHWINGREHEQTPGDSGG